MSKKKDLAIAIGMNIVWLLIICIFFNSRFEENDDIAMAYSAEGIYGLPNCHLVFQNSIIGKIISGLAELIPSIRWYCIIFFFMMFIAFCAISFVLVNVQGRINGIVSSIFILTFLGYQTYVIVQFTRVAAITTIGGAVLLFWLIEYAKTRMEKVFSGIIGVSLLLYGSMVRIQMFLVCIAIFAGIGLVRIISMLVTRNFHFKRIAPYIVMFGIIVVAAAGLEMMDQCYYAKDAEWEEYVEYNNLRSELWDYGFPRYSENEELYQSLGISQSNLNYYASWNMDTEKLGTDVLCQLVEAKEKTQFSFAELKSFFNEYPKRFFFIPLFSCYLIVAVISILLNKKNIIGIAYEIMLIMAFELYLFHTNRYGLNRIEVSLWMATIMAQLYLMSEDIRKEWKCSKKICIMLVTIILSLNCVDFASNIQDKLQDRTTVKNLFRLISEDDENLYAFTMKSGSYRLSGLNYFWEPAYAGEAKNVYHTSGWEIKNPCVEKVLYDYNISNVYRDSIDNENVFWVSDGDANATEVYIRENYNSNAQLNLVKMIDGQKFYKVRSLPITLSGYVINNDLADIESKISITTEDDEIQVEGYAYKYNTNSYQQRSYLKVKKKNGETISYFELTQSNNSGFPDIMNGKYSTLSGNFKLDEIEEYDLSVVLCIDGEQYEIIQEP